MIHERNISKDLNLNGPLRMVVASIKAALHEVEHSILIEEEGFHAIVKGSKVDFDTLREKAPSNWYIDAEEARDLSLVLDVI
jgi:ATP-dependent Clp protease, protease subunit